MSVSPQPGMPVLIVRRSAQALQWQAKILATKDASLALRVPQPPQTWDADGPYVLICGRPGSRVTAPAAFVAQKGETVAFKITGRWKQLDLRKDHRFPTDLKAEVRSVLGSSRQMGRVIDISLGGAAVTVESRPGGSQVEIGILANGYSARILCDVLNVSTSGEDAILHLKFRDMSAPHRAFIRQLVGQLMEAEDRAS